MADGRIEHYYRALGVEASASPEELKRAHRDLVQVWHPDRFTANPRLQKLAAGKLLEINQAYAALRSGCAPTDPAPGPAPDPEPVRTALVEPRRTLWQRLYPAVQTAGVAAAVFALIMAGRGFYALVNFKASPSPAPIVIQQEHTESPPESASERRVRANPRETLLANGYEIVEPRGRAGVGRLTVTNQTEQDAVATLLDQSTGSTVRMVYVTSGMQAQIGGIGPGVYRLSLESGSQWSWGAGGFTRNRAVSRPVGPFTFTQVQTAGQVRGDQYSIVMRHERAPGAEAPQAGM
jgi:hypothetical protein